MAVPNKTLYANCLGVFVFDNQYRLIAKELFDTATALEFLESGKMPETDFVAKFKNAVRLGVDGLPAPEILEMFRDEKFFDQYRKINILYVKKKINESFSRDQLIVQTVTLVEDLDKVINSLVKRLRDWYNITSPEINHHIESHEKFVSLILEKGKDTLLKELKVKKEEQMGPDLPEKDLQQILDLASHISALYSLKQEKTDYLESLMKEICPNVFAITGTMIGAKLVALAGSLRKLSTFPASTVQILGAEKALFRHLRTGSRPPKFGVILLHPFLANAKKDTRGKVARAVADKVSIAAKVDYFKGEFVGDKLRAQIEKKFPQ